MNKHDFLQHGLHIVERPNHLIVTTPQTFASGDPAHFCVRNSGAGLLFCDYGMTHNALELSLPDPDQASDIIRKSLDRLEGIIKFTDYALHAEVATAQTGQVIGEFLNIFALLTTYRPKTVHEQDIDNIMDNIRHYLVQKFGNFEEKVKYQGLSGADHRFAFAANNHIFDFTKPTAQATGQLLRKIHDVQSIHNTLTFNVFMDDGDKKQFDKESRILSSICNIKPLSILAA